MSLRNTLPDGSVVELFSGSLLVEEGDVRPGPNIVNFALNPETGKWRKRTDEDKKFLQNFISSGGKAGSPTFIG